MPDGFMPTLCYEKLFNTPERPRHIINVILPAN